MSLAEALILAALWASIGFFFAGLINATASYAIFAEREGHELGSMGR